MKTESAMDRYELFVTDASEADLNETADYIAFSLKEPLTALKLINRIKDAVLSLGEMPQHHRPVSDRSLSEKNIRFLPVDKYLIFYTINETPKKVTILRILHSRREWERLL